MDKKDYLLIVEWMKFILPLVWDDDDAVAIQWMVCQWLKKRYKDFNENDFLYFINY